MSPLLSPFPKGIGLLLCFSSNKSCTPEFYGTEKKKTDYLVRSV